MLRRITESLHPSRTSSLARAFAQVGWLGFWVQVLTGSLSVVLMLYVLVFNRLPSGPRAGLALVEYLTIASLLLLAFTTFWSYRYTRLAQELSAPGASVARSSVMGIVWTGLLASSLGVFFTVVVMLIETAHLLFYFLSMPQGGVPVIQTPAAGSAAWVSAIDMVSLMALVLTLTAEVIVLVSSLWLLFRSTQPSQEIPEPDAA